MVLAVTGEEIGAVVGFTDPGTFPVIGLRTRIGVDDGL